MVVIMELTDKWVAIHLATLYRCVKFYKTFPKIVDTVCRQSGTLLSWSDFKHGFYLGFEIASAVLNQGSK